MNSIDKQLIEYLKNMDLDKFSEQSAENNESFLVLSEERDYLVDYAFSSSEELENIILDSLSGKMAGDINLARLCTIKTFENRPSESGNSSEQQPEDCVIPDFVYAF